jgi:uncharacterized membrane protein
MKIASVADNNAINISAIISTITLSLYEFATEGLTLIESILPSLGIIAGILCTIAFARYHNANKKRVEAERLKVELEVEILKRKLDESSN